MESHYYTKYLLKYLNIDVISEILEYIYADDKKYSFVDDYGKFKIPINDTLILLNYSKLSKSDIRTLFDIFFNIYLQTDNILTVYISSETNFLCNRDGSLNWNLNGEYEGSSNTKITECVNKIIIPNYIKEYVVWASGDFEKSNVPFLK